LTLQEFPKPSPGLLKLLAESGETPAPSPPVPIPPQPTPVPEETKKRKLPDSSEEHRQPKKSAVAKVKDWTGKPSDMERLAMALQKLKEDDLLQIVRLVTDHKTSDMFVKNDLDGKPSWLSCLSC
jgi:transcription initiation factor IIF auxiliary subunit